MKPNLRSLQIIVATCLLVINALSCQKKIVPSSSSMFVNERTRLLVDEQEHVSPSVTALMKLTGLKEQTRLHDAVVATQEAWLRKAGVERMHLDEAYPDAVPMMLGHFDNLGLVTAIMPKAKHYDYVLLLGSTYRNVKERLSFLEHLAQSGVSFSTIALLGSHRPLERFFEVEPIVQEERFEELPITEIEMMEALFAQSTFKAFNKRQVLSVASAMKTLPDKRITRANTHDTVVDFLRLNKRPGSVLVISSQPYALRQHLVVQKALGPQWSVETVGGHAPSTLTTAVYLDELARTLFEIEALTTK